MDSERFDDITRLLTVLPSRRDVLRGLAGAGLGLALVRTPHFAGARKKRKHKKKDKKPKLTRNEFGCVDVGGNCLGNSANCCSGICEGTGPKKGKKDKSVCVAHDSGVCFADSDTCTVGQQVQCHPVRDDCSCVLTTGNAGFCGDFGFSGGPDSVCRECVRDTDCQAEFGPGAACVFLGGICSPACADTGRTACIRPCAEEAP
jgi:hypothetical protein